MPACPLVCLWISYARQAYHPLHGFNVVLGIMRMPLKRWPGHCLSVPIGLELSHKPKQTHKLGMPYRSRSPLARDIADCAAQQVSARHLRSLVDSGYANQGLCPPASRCAIL